MLQSRPPFRARTKSDELTIAIVPAGTSFPAVAATVAPHRAAFPSGAVQTAMKKQRIHEAPPGRHYL